jgi:hypothetical protein
MVSETLPGAVAGLEDEGTRALEEEGRSGAAAPVAGGTVSRPESTAAGKQRACRAERGDRRAQRGENQSCLLDEAYSR